MMNIFDRLASWWLHKSAPSSLTGGQWTGTGFIDSFKRNRNPTPNELQAELKGTAWTCASINAAVCASFGPRLFVKTGSDDPQPKCPVKRLAPTAERKLRAMPHLSPYTRSARVIEEVLDHPILNLLNKANPVHNAFDLWELTTLYQEVQGCAYWYLVFGPLGTPTEIWILPAQNVTPKRAPNSRAIVDFYEYRNGSAVQNFNPEQIIHFRYPDPRDPYTSGLSPLRACFEQVSLLSDYTAFKEAKFQNRAIPDAIVSPDEVIGEEERDRLESQWNSKFRRGGAGRILVAESALKVQLLNQSMGDAAAMAELGQTRQDIANAFHVPLSFLSTETNLANLQAADHQHMSKAIGPRLQRRDEKLNEQLVPLFDTTGRLFLASADPVPADPDATFRDKDINLKYGIFTINEIRATEGYDPVPWGDQPWLPANWLPADQHTPQRAADASAQNGGRES
jgi:HK97 family phage portal protein